MMKIIIWHVLSHFIFGFITLDELEEQIQGRIIIDFNPISFFLFLDFNIILTLGIPQTFFQFFKFLGLTPIFFFPCTWNSNSSRKESTSPPFLEILLPTSAVHSSNSSILIHVLVQVLLKTIRASIVLSVQLLPHSNISASHPSDLNFC